LEQIKEITVSVCNGLKIEFKALATVSMLLMPDFVRLKKYVFT